MELPITTIIDMYIADKKSEGLSPKTTDWYRDKLKMLARHLTKGSKARLQDFNLENVRAFISDLQSKDSRFGHHAIRPREEGKLSTYYIHGHVRTFKAFANWLFEERFTRQNTLAKLKRPSLPKPVINILTDEEIDRLVNSINPNTFLGMRLMCIVLLLLDTGIRASELLGIKLDDIDWKSDTIRVWGKGNRERIVSFDPQTKKPDPLY